MHRVIVVHSNQDYKSDDTPFPPIGAIGSIVQEEDEHGELEVIFDEYPFPIPTCKSWTVHTSMIIRKGKQSDQHILVDVKAPIDIYKKDGTF